VGSGLWISCIQIFNRLVVCFFALVSVGVGLSLGVDMLDMLDSESVPMFHSRVGSERTVNFRLIIRVDF